MADDDLIPELIATAPARAREMALAMPTIAPPRAARVLDHHDITSRIMRKDNYLIGSIPGSFTRLTGLTELDLRSNKLTGLVPPLEADLGARALQQRQPAAERARGGAE